MVEWQVWNGKVDPCGMRTLTIASGWTASSPLSSVHTEQPWSVLVRLARSSHAPGSHFTTKLQSRSVQDVAIGLVGANKVGFTTPLLLHLIF